MKTLTFIVLSLMLITKAINAQDVANPHYMDPYNPEFESNEILVKFKDNVEVVPLKSANGIVETGIRSFDRFSRTNRVVEMEKVFKTADRLKSAKTISINGESRDVPQLFNIYKLKLENQTDAKALAEELKNESEIEYAEPNYFVYSQAQFYESIVAAKNAVSKKDNTLTEMAANVAAPNDPLYGEQWYLQTINAEGAWSKEPTGGSGQVIGILDTGVDYLHPDLDDNIWKNEAELNGVEGVDDDGNGFVDDIMGWDWINLDNDPNDDNSHGTHVAGIAAAEQNNGTGISGVAFGAEIMPLKVLQSSGRGNSADLAAAITYAAENGATVINMSLGSYGESLTVKAALENAYANAFLVAAAGNETYAIAANECKDPIAIQYPAAYNFVFGVQATGQGPSDNCFDSALAGFSNYDPNGPASESVNYEGKAPGANIYSTFPNGNYKNLNGTSMASPVVAGTIALMQEYESQSHEKIFARLVQSTGNTLDAHAVLDYTLIPSLQYTAYNLVDTLTIGDDDGIPDAGETIEISLDIRNMGGHADSAWAILVLGEFEDPGVATIIDGTSYLGDVSEYASLSGELDPFKIELNSDIANGRDIVLEYEIGAKNWQNTTSGQIVLTVLNGTELIGVMDSTLTLTPDRLWITSSSFRVATTGTLHILPGTHIKLYNNFDVKGKVIGHGTPDSLIQFEGPATIIGQGEVDFKYTDFFNIQQNFGQDWSNEGPYSFTKCNFYNINLYTTDHLFELKNVNLTDCDIRNCKFGNLLHSFGGVQFFTRVNVSNCKITWNSIYKGIYKHNNFVRFFRENGTAIWTNGIFEKTNFISIEEEKYFLKTANNTDIVYHENNYWGTVDEEKIEEKNWDFWDDAALAMIDYTPFLTQPSDSAHGVVWKIEVNEIDPQDEHLDPVGAEELKFDVYFNKCMDTTFTPQLSFGVREPYVQRIVSKNGKWSADSTVWTAYYDVGLETGDGINTIRVQNAVDTAGFEIPVETERFQFTIQAAGAASLAFQATPGIGKVDLEWPASNTDDALGYNLYRCYMLNDSTTSDTVLINTELVIDTTFLDTEVIPDTTYKYLYKTVGTDMQETDFSKAVSATPINAANGDANGDLAVNVSDIVTIVNYILENDPQPFLYDAADVNYDDAIDVLDIVTLVNIIMAPQSSTKAALARNAQISLEDGIVYVNSPVELGGIQFTLADVSAEQEVEILEALEGFEVIRKMEDGKLTVLAYSLSGKTLSEGKTALLKLNNRNTWIFEAVLSNTNGQSIEYTLTGPATVVAPLKLNAGFDLGQNYPNPFTGNTTIPFELQMEVDEVQISVFDIMGRKVQQWQLQNLNRGEHKVEWTGEGKTGVYLYKMYVKQNGQRSYTQTKRMIVR